jgi:hypothetical protein
MLQPATAVLLYVGEASDKHLLQTTGVILVGEVALDPFPSCCLQRFATFAQNAPVVGINGGLFCVFALPLPRTSLRLGDVGSHLQFMHAAEHSVAVISLIGDTS